MTDETSYKKETRTIPEFRTKEMLRRYEAAISWRDFVRKEGDYGVFHKDDWNDRRFP